TSTGLIDLGTLEPPNNATLASFAYGVTGDGAVVVGFSEIAGGSSEHAFRWTQAGGMVDLGSAKGAGGLSRAFKVRDEGNGMVGESDFPTGPRRAFRWTQGGGFQDLDPSGFGLAAAISGDGSVVVGYDKTHAFRWTQAGGIVDIGTLPGRSNA